MLIEKKKVHFTPHINRLEEDFSTKRTKTIRRTPFSIISMMVMKFLSL